MRTIEYAHPIRVRYAETDQMDVVWHGNFFLYFEEARTEALRHLGLRYRDMEREGFLLPVVGATIRYHQPAHYDDLITVKVTVANRPTVRISFSYEIVNEDGERLVTGQTDHVFLDPATRRPRRAPPAIAALFEEPE